MNTGKASDEVEKGQKRCEPEHDNSFEEIRKFRRSKLTPRSPIKVQEPQKDTCFNMEEIRKMLREFKEEFKEDIAEIKTEIRTERI
ncbi:hypothetical protein QE152_g21903 [Popillia japonica]|uniref:Uncharacterized protein n=1 Tax=Popillia japonica TaxID=7064 RepID=A0AAW1KN57_POPJA